MPHRQAIDFERLQIRPVAESDPHSGFCSGDDDLDSFLADDALDYERTGTARTHVALYDGELIAFIALLTEALELKTGEKKRLGKRHGKVRFVPAIKIGRLAVSKDFRSKYRGVGETLIRYAWSLADRASETIGCRLLIVDAYGDAVAFYERMGFRRNKNQAESGPTIGMHLDLKAQNLPFLPSD